MTQRIWPHCMHRCLEDYTGHSLHTTRVYSNCTVQIDLSTLCVGGGVLFVCSEIIASVAQASLEFLIFLSLPPKCWNNKSRHYLYLAFVFLFVSF